MSVTLNDAVFIVSFQGDTHRLIPPVSTICAPSVACQNTYTCLGSNQVSDFDYQHIHPLTFASPSSITAEDQRPKGLEGTLSRLNAAIETPDLAKVNTNTRSLPPTAYFRYQGAIVNEMEKRGVQVMLPNASRWISSRWRSEDIRIKTAFSQLAEIREAEDKRKTPEEKATVKRARRQQGGTDSGHDSLLGDSTNPEARQLADVISAWVVTIPSLSPQELEKQMMPVNLRRKGKERGSSRFFAELSEALSESGPQPNSFSVLPTLPPWTGGRMPEAESDDEMDAGLKKFVEAASWDLEKSE